MTAVLHRPGRIGAGRQESAPAVLERSASPVPQNHLRRLLSLSGLAWQQVRRAPATICCVAAVWVAGLVTGSIAHGPSRWLSGHVGAGVPSLGHGYWWTPLSAGLWAPGPGGTDPVLGRGQDQQAQHGNGQVAAQAGRPQPCAERSPPVAVPQ